MRKGGISCSLPNRWISLTIGCISTIGLGLSLNTLSNCRFVTIREEYSYPDALLPISPPENAMNSSSVPEGTAPVIQVAPPAVHKDADAASEDIVKAVNGSLIEMNIYSRDFGFGLITNTHGNSCRIGISFSETNPMVIAAVAFGVLAVFFGIIGMIISWCCVCLIACDIRFIREDLGILFGCITLFQGLTFLFLGADICKYDKCIDIGADICKHHKCILGSTAGLNIAAMVLWAFAALLSFFTSPFDDVSNGAVLPITSPPMKNVTEKIIKKSVNHAQTE